MGTKTLRIGERVRIVRADGCMAHIRNDPREGVVINIRKEKVYGGDSVPYPDNIYAEIRLDDGKIVKKCAVRRLWTVHDGLPEFQE